MHVRTLKWLVVLIASTTIALVTAPAATAASPAPADPAGSVLAWNAYAGQAALDACLAPGNNPLHESRLYAVTHIAIHDALNAIDRRSGPYVFKARRLVPGASADAAVAAAAHKVLVTLIGQLPDPPSVPACKEAAISGVEAAFAVQMAMVEDGDAKAQGTHLGEAAAAAILALRTGDGSTTPLFDTEFEQGDSPGEYRFTPGFDFVLAPGWADVTPFALERNDQFPSHPPYPLTSPQYAADLEEVKQVGQDTSTERTDDQTELAQFWYESSPLQWNRIARTVAGSTPRLSEWGTARLFGLLNMAMADGYIASWETKRVHNTWRPITAIRAADTDGNRATKVDPTWSPLLTTPPVSALNSGHSVEGAAAAEVMKQFFGTDHRSFTTCSLTVPEGTGCGSGSDEVVRSFTSFAQAADENAASRIYDGIHFRQDVEEGLRQGRSIGDHAVDQEMVPGR